MNDKSVVVGIATGRNERADGNTGTGYETPKLSCEQAHLSLVTRDAKGRETRAIRAMMNSWWIQRGKALTQFRVFVACPRIILIILSFDRI